MVSCLPGGEDDPAQPASRDVKRKSEYFNETNIVPSALFFPRHIYQKAKTKT